MAEQRVKYIIDLIASDKKLRQQMSKWDWSDIMGANGKGFGDIIIDGAKVTKDELRKILGGLNIDWSKVLGTKEIGQLEQAVTRALSNSRKELEVFANKGDTTGIENIIKLVSGLGNELKDLGSSFDATSLARGMSAFMKVLTPITAKFESLADEPKKVEAAFDKLFDSISGGAKSVNLGKSFEITGTIKAALKTIGATQKEIDKASESLENYKKLVQDFKGKTRIDSKLKNDVAGLTIELDKLIQKEADLAASGKTSTEEYAKTVKKMMAYENARLKLGAKPTINMFGEKLSGEFSYYEDIIDRFVNSLSDKIVKLEEKLGGMASDSFAKTISDQISNINIQLSVDEKAKTDFKNELNTFINGLSQNKEIASAKVNIDWGFNPTETFNEASSKVINIDNIKKALEDEIQELGSTISKLEEEKKHYDEIVDKHTRDGNPNKGNFAKGESNKLETRIGELKELIRANQHLLDTSDDPTTRQYLTSTLNSFKAVQKVVESKQGAILEKTHQWRQKMIDAMTMDKADANIQLGFDKGLEPSLDNLYNAIQNYFEANEIELHINKEAFTQEIKNAVEQGGVATGIVGGGGTVNLDPSTLVSAIATGLQAALTGDFTPVVAKTIATSATKTPEQKKNKYLYLNPESDYVKHVVEAFRGLAEYSQGKGAPAAKVRNFFDTKLKTKDDDDETRVDLKSLVDGTTMDLVDALSRLIETSGSTLVDEIDNLIKDTGKNNILKNFRGNIAELLHTQNIGQVTMDEETRKRRSIEVFKDYSKQSRLVGGIKGIFDTTNKNWVEPSVEAIQELMSVATSLSDTAIKNGNASGGEYYKKIANMLSALQTARADLTDLNDESQKNQLMDAIDGFKSNVYDIYLELQNYLHTFEMDVDVKDHKKPYRVAGSPSASRVMKAINEDYANINDVRIYRDPSTSALGVTRQEKMLMRGYDIKDSLIVPYPDRTDILYRDTSIDDFSPSEKTSRKWADNALASAQAAERGRDIVARRKASEDRANKATEEEKRILDEIASVQNSRNSIQNEIDANQQKIDKLSTDGRKIAGARTRLANRSAAVSQSEQEKKNAEQALQNAKVAKEAAERARAEIEKQNAKNAYKEWDEKDRAVAKYEAWAKSPMKYRKEIGDEIYADDLRNATYYRNKAQDDVRAAQVGLSNIDAQIRQKDRDLEQSKKFNNAQYTQSLEKELEVLKRQQQAQQQKLDRAVTEQRQYQDEINSIYLKRKGTSAEDKAAFLEDVKKRIRVGKDEDGNPTGKLYYARMRRAELGDDPRVLSAQAVEQANAQYDAAQKEYDRAEAQYNNAQKAYNAIQSDKSVKKASEIDALKAKNQELNSQVAAKNGEIESLKQQQVDNKAKLRTTSEDILTAPKKEDIDSLLLEAEQLDRKIQESKREAQEVDAFVEKKYKKVDSAIKHTKSDTKKINKYTQLEQRAQYLTEVANGVFKENWIVPENITSAMSKIIETVLSDRSILKALKTDFDIDKFASDADLKAELQGRLARADKGEVKLHPIVQEFYKQIINNGKEVATSWMEQTIKAHTQSEATQVSKLKSLAQKDSDTSKSMESEIQLTDENLQLTYQTRVSAWFKSLRQKIQSLDSGKLGTQDAALATKEVENLFASITNAIASYRSKFKGTGFKDVVEKLQHLMDSGKITPENYNHAIEVLQTRYSKILEQELIGDNQDLLTRRSEFLYDRHLNADVDTHIGERKNVISQIDELLSQREGLLQTRQAELLGSIADTIKSGSDTTALETELKGVNEELAKYSQYHKQMAAQDLMSLFADDAEFANNYKTSLAEIIHLEQQADLAKVKGASQDDLNSQYKVIDEKKSALNRVVYDNLTTQQNDLIGQITTLSKEGKSTKELETRLEDVNTQLIELEINKRRAEEVKISGSLWDANVQTVQMYNEELRKTIQLEQELAVAEAKGVDASKIKDDLRKQKSRLTREISQAQQDRLNQEAWDNPRVQALEYLRNTDRAYSTAQEKRWTIKSRIKRKTEQLDDIENDQKYSTSWQYRQHQRVVKDRLVSEYVGSDKYYTDRDAGYKKVEAEMATYLEQELGPEVARQVLYQLMNIGDKIDPTQLKEAYANIQRDGFGDTRKFVAQEYKDSAEYQSFKASREQADERALTERMAEQKDALSKSFEEIDKRTSESIRLIQTATENDYLPLKEEMNKVSSRVNLSKMQTEFANMLKGINPNNVTNIEGLRRSLIGIARRNGANDNEASELLSALEGVGTSKLKNVDRWAPRVLSGVFATTEEEFRTQARGQLVMQEEARAQAEKDKLQKAYDKEERYVKTSLNRETQQVLNDKVDAYIVSYFEQWVNTALTDSVFDEEAGDKTKGIMDKFKALLEENVYKLVSKYADGLVVKDGVLHGINIRDEVAKMLKGEIGILEDAGKENDVSIAHIEEQRKAAMKFGSVGYNEIADAEVLEEQAILASKLTQEKERQKLLTEEITKLEQEGDSSEELGRLNKQLDATKESISHLQMLVDNRDTLMELQHEALRDQKAIEKWDPERQKLWYQNKIEVARAKLDTADEPARKDLEQQITRWTEAIARMDDIIAQRQAEEDAKKPTVASVLANALKEAFGGKGGFALDASGVASEATLSQILQILTGILNAFGGTVIKDPNMEQKLARIRELEAKRGSTPVKSVVSTDKKAKQEDPDYIVKAREYAKKELAKITSQDELAGIAQKLVTDIENAKKGTKEALELQLKLQKVVNKSGELYKTSTGKKTYKPEDIGKLLGIGDRVNLRLSEKNAVKSAEQGLTESNKQLENEKAKSVESQKQLENKKQETAITKQRGVLSAERNAFYEAELKYKPKELVPEEAQSEAIKLKATLDEMYTKGEADTIDFMNAQVKLANLLSALRVNLGKGNASAEDWKSYVSGFLGNTDNVLFGNVGKKDYKSKLKALGIKDQEEAKPAQQKAEAKEREAVAEEKIAEAKKEQKAITGGWTKAEEAEHARLVKETAGYSPEVVFDEVGTGLALDSTLQSILAEIKKIQTQGIKKGGSTSSATKNKNRTEADLIRDRALSQDEVVKGLAAGRGDLYDKYIAEVDALNKAVDAANKAKKNKKKVDIGAVKTAAEKVSALTRNILRDTADWDYKTTQSDIVKDYKLPSGQKMTKARMEQEAQKIHGINKKNSKYKYDFLGFDGDTLSYQLTDIEGKVRKVTMEWNEFNQQLAITSDKSVGELSELATNVDKLKNKFADAQAVGYLNADDANLKAFTDQVTAIDDAIANSDTFENIETMRKKAVALGDVVNKTINKNKGWMVGNGAKKQLDNQYNKIFGARQASGEEFADESPLFKTYDTAYNALNAQYQKYVDSHQLNDPKIQKQIQQQAAQVQILGKKYLASVTQADKLNDLVEQSGSYKDARTGEERSLGGSTNVTTEELTNLESKMRDFVQNGLRQANIEGVKFDSVNQRLTYTFRTSKNSVADMVVQYNDATQALYAYQKQERESLTGLAGFMQSMRAKMKSILQYTASITSIYRLWGTLKQGVQYIREIDSALTELKKVTDETEETYDRFLQTAAKTADKVGSTIQKVVSSTADWARLGYSLEDAARLAESTSVLLNVSEFQSIEDATSALTSTLQAFGYTASQSMNVVDVLNEVGNNFAISSDGIATALQDSASSLMAANNSYEEAVALIAAANRVVQDPNSVGAALRTISLRLRGTSTKELEEAGEDTDGAIESKSKLRSKIKGLSGVDILTDSGAYKSTYEILLDISKVWKDMSDINQAALLEILAGKTRSNTAAAILSNTKDLEEAYVQALEAEGSALQENEKYLDSIQGRIDLFTNSVQTMWSNALDSDAIKTIVDFGTELVKFIDKIGLLPSILGGVFVYLTAFKKHNPVTIIKDIGTYFTNGGLQAVRYGSALNGLTIQQQALKMATAGLTQQEIAARLAKENSIDATKAQQVAEEAVTAAKIKQQGVTAQQILQDKEKGLISLSNQATTWLEKQNTEALTRAKLQEALASGAVTKQDYLEIAAKYGLLSATEALKLGIKGLGATIKAFMASNPVGWILMIISAVISLISWLSSMDSEAEQLADRMSELQSELSSLKSDIDSLNSELETTKERMTELLALPSLSFVEQEELNRLKAQTEELERQLEVKEMLAESANDQLVSTAEAHIDAAWNDEGRYYVDHHGAIQDDDDNWYDMFSDSISTKDALDESMRKYQVWSRNLTDLQESLRNWKSMTAQEQDWVLKGTAYEGQGKDGLIDYIEFVEQKMRDIETGISMVFADEGFQGLSYGMSTKIDEFLDEMYAYQLQWKQLQGEYVKSQAISSLFDTTSTEAMQKLGKELKQIADNDALTEGQKNKQIQDRIDNINTASDAYNRLNIAMETVGVTAQDIANYFVLETGRFNSDTIEGITNQYAEALKIMNKLKSMRDGVFTLESETSKTGTEIPVPDIGFPTQGKTVDAFTVPLSVTSYNWDDFFSKNDEGKFEAKAEKFGEILQGMDKDCQKTFISLAESVKNAELTWEEAMEIFRYEGDLAGLELITEQITALNSVYFGDVADDFNGLIDTVSELKAALDSVATSMDLVHTAQKQMNSSGRISVKTALELMESTDNWDKILTITNGTIEMSSNAEEILIQEKLDHIKANYQQALSEVQTQIAAIKAKGANAELSMTLDQSTNKAVVNLAANMAYLNQIMTANARIAAGDLSVNMDQVIADAEAIKKQTLNDLYTEEVEVDAATQTLADLEAEEKKLKQQLKVLENVDTTDEFSDYYDYDEHPGDKYDDSKDTLEALQKKYERQIKNLDNQQTYIQNEIDRLEAEDQAVSKSYYEEQIALEEKKLGLYQQERAELLKLNRTDEVADALWEVEHAIQESTMRMVEFRQSIIDLYKTAFDDVIGAYDNKDDLLSDQQNFIDKYQELMELQGGTKTAGGFQEQIAIEEEKMADNIAELDALRQAFAEGMTSGYIEEGSEEWVDMQDEIRAAEAAVLDNKIAIEQYRDELKQLSVDAFELVRNAFSNKDNFLTSQQDYIQGYADLLEAQGIDAPTELYDKLIEIEQEKRANNVANLVSARQDFANIEAAGYTAADEEWQDAYQQIVELEKAVQDNDVAMTEYAKTIRDLDFEKFERFVSRLDDINSEIDHIRNLLDGEDVAFDDGTWTEEGITSLGLLYHQMELNKQKSAEYAQEIEALNAEYAEGSMSEQAYYERLQELKEGQWDAIDAYESAKDAMIDMEEARIDMIEEGINEEIEAYQELIDLKREELDAERDLYEFKKDVEKQTKDISSLQRRIASLSGSTDAADVAERRRLQAELDSAQEELNDSYYSHSKDQQNQALDDEMEAYQKSKDDYLELLRDALEDTEALINEKIQELLVNADVTLNGLNTVSQEYGVTLSDLLMQPWQNASVTATSFKDLVNENLSFLTNEDGVITLFGTDAQAMLEGVFTAGGNAASLFNTTVTTQIGLIKQVVNSSTSELTSKLKLPWESLTGDDSPINTFSSDAKSAITEAVQTARNNATNMTTNLTSPWKKGTEAANTFSTTVGTVLDNWAKKAEEAAKKVSNATDVKYPSYVGTGDGSGGNGSGNGNNNNNGNNAKFNPSVQALQRVLNTIFKSGIKDDGYWGIKTETALRIAQQTMRTVLQPQGLTVNGRYDSGTRTAMRKYIDYLISHTRGMDTNVYYRMLQTLPPAFHAKGTLGTKRDEWAITDESWIGEEITLAAGKNGQLQYLKKGSAVMPADISQNLVEWGKLNPNMLSFTNSASGINVITNAINKPEIKLDVENFLKVDRVDRDTLPDLEKLMDKKIETFARQLNYSLKKIK